MAEKGGEDKATAVGSYMPWDGSSDGVSASDR
jgi:hypothetical protein